MEPGFELVARYRRLGRFFDERGLDPEAERIAKRIGRIEAVR